MPPYQVTAAAAAVSLAPRRHAALLCWLESLPGPVAAAYGTSRRSRDRLGGPLSKSNRTTLRNQEVSGPCVAPQDRRPSQILR